MFTVADSDTFSSPKEILPITQENKKMCKELVLLYHEIVCCVYSLESPHRGDSNEYTQHTIIIKKIVKTFFKKPICLLTCRYDNS